MRIKKEIHNLEKIVHDYAYFSFRNPFYNYRKYKKSKKMKRIIKKHNQLFYLYCTYLRSINWSPKKLPF